MTFLFVVFCIFRTQPRSLESSGHRESESQRDSAADLGICEIVVTEPRLRLASFLLTAAINAATAAAAVAAEGFLVTF